jgi:phosphopantothenoylcysteine decarboxylase
MNTYMWSSRFTELHLAALADLGVSVIDPVAKRLACGDVGDGAMASVPDIVAAVKAALDVK